MFHSFIAMYSLFLAFINKDSPAQTHCDQVAWFVTSKNHYLDAKRQESLDQVPKLVSAPNSPKSASTKAQGCRRERGLKDSAVAKPGTKKKKKSTLLHSWATAPKTAQGQPTSSHLGKRCCLLPTIGSYTLLTSHCSWYEVTAPIDMWYKLRQLQKLRN